jgi:hypothetical protein
MSSITKTSSMDATPNFHITILTLRSRMTIRTDKFKFKIHLTTACIKDYFVFNLVATARSNPS